MTIDNSNINKTRLAKVIAQCGITSRRQAEEYIQAGRVQVNGVVKKEVTTFVDFEKDVIRVDGKEINLPNTVRIWAYHKPAGVITTHRDPEGRPTVFQEVKKQGLPHVVSVGRLDINSEGLLLLTNQGSFAHFAESPKTAWKRCYRVRVFGDTLPVNDLMSLQSGITIDGFHYSGIEVDIQDNKTNSGRNTWLLVTLTEGKNREIRKILNHLGLSVNRLIRVSYGPFELSDIAVGKVKEIPQSMVSKYYKK